MDSKKQPENHHDIFTAKVLWIIIGFLLFVVVVSSVAWYQTIKSTPKVDQQVTTNPTADWKTYSNNEYGFEIKYPAAGHVDKLNDGKIVVASGKEAMTSPSLVFWATLNGKIERGSQITFAGKTAYRELVPGEIGNDFTRTVIPLADVDLVIDSTPGNTIEDQMLSTFKFTNSATSADWKTYTNTEYGFEFQYPSSDCILQVDAKQIFVSKKCPVVKTDLDGPEGYPIVAGVYLKIIEPIEAQGGLSTKSIINGNEVYYAHRECDDGPCGYKDFWHVGLKKTGDQIEIPTNLEQVLVNQILSTFKFTK